MKVKKEEVINMFMHFCANMNKSLCLSVDEVINVKKWVEKSWSVDWQPYCMIVPYGTVGAWRLDYNPTYGGWQIQEFDNGGGGIDCPLGHRRFKSSEFLAMLCFARETLRLSKIEKK